MFITCLVFSDQSSFEFVAQYSGLQLSWLECTPDKGEVPGSSPGRPTIFKFQIKYKFLEVKNLYLVLNQNDH